MARRDGAMHVARNRRRYVAKSGDERVYESVLLRRSVRRGTKVGHETLANLSALPAHVIDVLDQALKGASLAPVGEAFRIRRSIPHGHVAAVAAMATKLGLPGLLGPACRARDLAMALVISRVVHPGSKLSTRRWWADTTLAEDLDIAAASTDEIYAAMDWLGARQEAIEKQLARRHLEGEANPSGMAMFDLTSSWVEGARCGLAARGYSRDQKMGKAQIEYGLLTDPDGRPVAVRVFAGNTADPAAFSEITNVVRTTFGLENLVMVGDRGMITTARIDALREHTELGWVTALRAPAIQKLAADDGPLQLTLFDETDLAEISHPDYPGERLVACRNPFVAAERARKRDELLAATEALLEGIAARVQAGRLSGADDIGVAVGKVINTYKMSKHFTYQITETSFSYQRRGEQIAAEAALDGIYVLRTSVPTDELDAPGVIVAYKNLAHLERDFRSIKTDDLGLRPIYHHLSESVRAHVLICMLAAYLTWHLRRAWAPLTFTDEHPPQRDNPVTPAQRSTHAATKASYQHDAFGHPYRSFQGLLDHLATLTRNDVQFAGAETTVPTLAEATSDQRQAFELIEAPIPVTLM